jgi:DNA-binding transcriptional ArsR family regulator
MASNNTWDVRQSIVLEMEVIFSMLNDYLPRASLSENLQSLIAAVPGEMEAELRRLLGKGERFYSLLAPAAYAADTLYEVDYARATLPIRQMRLEDLIESTLRMAARDGVALQPDLSLPLVKQFEELHVDLLLQIDALKGINTYTTPPLLRELRADLNLITHFLADGDRHTQFWHWMDRFYYQVYQPWRSSRQALLDSQEKRALLSLGAPGSPLRLDWLPENNPLRLNHNLQNALQKGSLLVTFLVEPFELPDCWWLLPGGIAATFAEWDNLYKHFHIFLDHLTLRLKALADPTRLAIMRTIRRAPTDNTEIAIQLGLSRPTVSIHAKQLREAGLIRTYEDGRSVRHVVVAEEIRQLYHDLERFLDLPDENTPPEE